MCKKNERKADEKGRMAGLMTKQEHAADSANAAADDSQQQQGRFWNALQLPAGTVFVRAHGRKSDQIDQQQIRAKNIPKRHFRFPLPGLAFFFALGFAQPALYAPFFGFAGAIASLFFAF